MSAPSGCIIRGCEGGVTAWGLCRPHYLRAWRAGDLDRFKAAHATRTAVEGRRRRSHPRATVPRVPIERARAHVLQLMEQGLGLERIAEAAAVGSGVVGALVYGQRGARRDRGLPKSVRADHEQRLLALSAEDVRAGYVSGEGMTRRLRALVAIGYTETELAERLGVAVANLNRWVSLGRETVLSSSAEAVAALYAELEMTPRTGPAARRARRLAERRGWLPPLAWDDIDLDPSPPVPVTDEATPWRHLVDHAAVELAVTGARVRLSPASLREAVRVLHERRWSHAGIAEQLGVDRRTVSRVYAQLNLTAWTKDEILGGPQSIGLTPRRAA